MAKKTNLTLVDILNSAEDQLAELFDLPEDMGVEFSFSIISGIPDAGDDDGADDDGADDAADDGDDDGDDDAASDVSEDADENGLYTSEQIEAFEKDKLKSIITEDYEQDAPGGRTGEPKLREIVYGLQADYCAENDLDDPAAEDSGDDGDDDAAGGDDDSWDADTLGELSLGDLRGTAREYGVNTRGKDADALIEAILEAQG